MNENAKPNGLKQALNWPTVVLILLSGSANLFVTDRGTRELSYEQQEALGKIRELYANLDDFEARQKHVLDNQNTMMRSDSEVIKEIHTIVKQFQETKH
jgi:hypothetical protein